MKQITTLPKRYFIILSLFFGVLLSFGLLGLLLAFANNLTPFQLLLRKLINHYVEEVDPSVLMRQGIEAMLGSLAPYTEFVPESELEDFKMNYVSKQYAGIGASVFNNKAGKVIVSEPYEGFSAQKADIR